MLARARKELEGRRDVYGYDLVAWALHAKGRDVEARTMMRHALSRGTEDAMLFYHAGMIARAVGDTADARTDLTRALEINASFHHLHANEARALLASFGVAGSRGN